MSIAGKYETAAMASRVPASQDAHPFRMALCRIMPWDDKWLAGPEAHQGVSFALDNQIRSEPRAFVLTNRTPYKPQASLQPQSKYGRQSRAHRGRVTDRALV